MTLVDPKERQDSHRGSTIPTSRFMGPKKTVRSQERDAVSVGSPGLTQPHDESTPGAGGEHWKCGRKEKVAGTWQGHSGSNEAFSMEPAWSDTQRPHMQGEE